MESDEVDATYTQLMKQLEQMHLIALANAKVLAICPPGQWDTDQGEALIESIKTDWEACRSG
jgi:hypothetical protein